MSDDIEQLLGSLTPRGARPELRPHVLAAVVGQLQAEAASSWLRRSVLAAAAAVLLAVALNVWVGKLSERHLARLFGPPPVSKRAAEVAKAVEEATDAQTGQWVYQRLAAATARPSPNAAAKYYAAVERLIRELQTVSKDHCDETPQKDSQMDRRGSGRAGGDTTDGQRLVRLDVRCTA
jgi:hypothetical protein